jgi:hypothetical protein
MNNEVNNENINHGEQPIYDEKLPLQDLDLSNLILIKNPNNEVAIGNNTFIILGCAETKLKEDVLNTTGSEKQITHQRYGTFNNPNGVLINQVFVSPERFYALKIEVLLIKYTVLLLSLVLITLDIKNIRNRIASQDEIISEVIEYFI